MKQEFVRNPYNYDSDKLSTDTGLHCKDESLTEQEHLDESDINYIAERFMRTGAAPQVLHMPTYGDFSGIFDFQSAMNVINAAKQEFMSLPAKIRARFNNDPHELVNFIEDPSNRDEAIKLGFIEKPVILAPLDNPTGDPDEQGSSRTTQSNPKDSTRSNRAQNPTQKDKGAEST